MKSPQLTKLSDQDNYSDLQVMQSNAGFYVGSEYKDGTPGTRDSGYYPTREAAEQTLALMLNAKANP